jgi:predicted LPLAT superfamily acyltransferase
LFTKGQKVLRKKTLSLNACSMQAVCMQYAGSIQAVCRQYAGNMEAVCRQYTGSMQAVCRQYAGNMEAVCRQYAYHWYKLLIYCKYWLVHLLNAGYLPTIF